MWGWRTPEELATSAAATTDWIVPNMIARQHVTVVYAEPKVVKSGTVVAGILAPLSRCEGVFNHPPPSVPVLAVILSEETIGRWKSHVENFGPHGGRLLTRGKVPSGVSFTQAVEEAARYAASIGAAIVVSDTLTAHAGLAGDAENGAGKMGEALDLVLRAAAAHNIAFVLIHHVRKWTKDADPADVELLRVRGNFAAKVDFLVHVTKPSDAPGRFRRRKLHVTGRLECEPYSLLIEKVPGAPTSASPPGPTGPAACRCARLANRGACDCASHLRRGMDVGRWEEDMPGGGERRDESRRSTTEKASTPTPVPGAALVRPNRRDPDA